jgi:hypothetical protein
MLLSCTEKSARILVTRKPFPYIDDETGGNSKQTGRD